MPPLRAVTEQDKRKMAEGQARYEERKAARQAAKARLKTGQQK